MVTTTSKSTTTVSESQFPIPPPSLPSSSVSTVASTVPTKNKNTTFNNNTTGSSITAVESDNDDVMSITPLGSGQEVGRSCHLIEFRNIRLLCDIGIHPGYDGIHGLPFLDTVIDLSTIDILLVTHFHLDHVAALPYLTEHTNFRGHIYMTHPTKAVTRLLLGDYIRLLQMQQQQKGGGGGGGGKENQEGGKPPEEMLYTEKDLYNCLNKVICIDYHTVITYQTTKDNSSGASSSLLRSSTGATTSSSGSGSGGGGTVSFYALNAGHVLGACMYYITMGGDRTILYTGDYSMEDDRHLMAAELPFISVNTNSSSTNNTTTTTTNTTTNTDVLICESTYGVQVHASRTERETRFTTTIERIVSRGGKCLIPVFALGRAQELLLILDEYWQNNPHLQNIPIWYASKLASRALRVYQTYSNMMNIRIRNQMDVSNPFHFRFIQNLKSINVSQSSNNNNNGGFDDTTPCVVFASPGMLQSGVSRQLFDRWASDPKNGVMIAGYAVEHTLAKEIMLQPKEVMTMDGRKQPLNCLVDYVSFSAHVDFVQNRNFITRVAPKHIVLVHGQKDEMGRLKSALLLQYKHYPENKRPTITMPPNQIEVKLKFARRRSAKVMGQLATAPVTTSNDEEEDGTTDDNKNIRSNKNRLPVEGEVVQGILVTQNFQSKIVTPSDLATYTPLRVGSIASKLHVPFAGSIHTLQLFLHEMFANITEEPITEDNQSQQSLDMDSERTTNSPTMYTLHNGDVRIIMGQQLRVVIVEWQASPAADVLADSVVALIMHAQSSAASIRYTSKPCHRPRDLSAPSSPMNDDSDNEATQKKFKPDSLVNDRLRFVRTVLKEQFQNVEAVYDAYKGTYDIVTDTGFETNATTSIDATLQCQIVVEFDDALANTAKITVECQDQKIASNIQITLQNAIAAAAAVQT